MIYRDPSLMTFVLPRVPVSWNKLMRKPGRAIYAKDKDDWRDLLLILKNRRKGTELWWEQKDDDPPKKVVIQIVVGGPRVRDPDRLCITSLVDAMGSRKQLRFGKDYFHKRVIGDWVGVGILIDDRCTYVAGVHLNYIKIGHGERGRTIVRILPADCLADVDALKIDPKMLNIDPFLELEGKGIPY